MQTTDKAITHLNLEFLLWFPEPLYYCEQGPEGCQSNDRGIQHIHRGLKVDEEQNAGNKAYHYKDIISFHAIHHTFIEFCLCII
ncbi:hypothetical protein PATA110616_07395 [Paenibacillus tarimensis]